MTFTVEAAAFGKSSIGMKKNLDGGFFFFPSLLEDPQILPPNWNAGARRRIPRRGSETGTQCSQCGDANNPAGHGENGVIRGEDGEKTAESD